MLALLLATTLNMQQALTAFEDFCAKAEVQIKRPLTDEMLTKKIVDAEHDSITVRIEEQYRLTRVRGKLISFADLTEDFGRRLGRLDPADMQRWSEEACLLSETNALQIAQRVFLRLGFDERDFNPVEVHRYSWTPSPADPEHVLWLPVFAVRWYQKGYSRDRAVPASVQMDISGTSKKLLHYLDATEKPSLMSKLLGPPKVSPPPQASSSPLTQPELATCQKFLQAIGAQVAGTNEAPFIKRSEKFPGAYLAVFQARYHLSVGKDGQVYEFANRSEDFTFLTLTERYDELRKWGGQSATVSTNQAVVIASNYLQKLGFDPAGYSLAQIKQFDHQFTDPEHPDKPVDLPPSYLLVWVSKKPFWAFGGENGLVTLQINSASTNLVSLNYAPSTYRFW